MFKKTSGITRERKCIEIVAHEFCESMAMTKWNNEDRRTANTKRPLSTQIIIFFATNLFFWAWIDIKIIIIICLHSQIRNDRHYCCQCCAKESYIFLYLKTFIYTFFSFLNILLFPYAKSQIKVYGFSVGYTSV